MASQAKTTAGAYSGFAADPLAVEDAALQHAVWRSFAPLSSLGSSFASALERFLDRAGFDRAPWLAVGFASGIGLWFGLANRWEWLAAIALCLAAVFGAGIFLSPSGRFPYLQQAVIGMGLMLAAGCAVVWAKSAIVGTPPIARPTVAFLIGRVLERTDQPDTRVRLVLAAREPRTGRAIRVRVNLPAKWDRPELAEGAVVRLRAFLMPPSPRQFPGSADFARIAWFQGVSATGSVTAPPELVTPPSGAAWLARLRHALAGRVRAQIPGSPGGIGAVFASGEHGGIAPADAQAMRDAGLAHLLAVSGLHVSAVVAITYLLTIRLLALLPPLALRLNLPMLAAGAGAIAAVGYTLLTGAGVGTLRACFGALLVLAALALGRQPLSLRSLAVAALAVMLFWPEALVGASFQMSFGSVAAIIALYDCRPVREFIAHRAEPWYVRLLREVAMLMLTGMVIDIALMPVALFHFHRAGLYGSVANLMAIPLTASVCMPLLAISLALDSIGLGAPAWWLTAKSLTLLLGIAHGTASRPGAVTLVPDLGLGRYLVFAGAMLWLALWRGPVRLWALIPAVLAALSLAWLRPPDLLITGEGRNLGVVSENGQDLLIFREGRSSFTRDAMLEAAGIAGRVAPLDSWPGAHCNHDYCLVELSRGGRLWRILIARTKARVPGDQLASACAGVDIVIAQQKLFGPCHPALIRADRSLLMRTGGLALDLVNRTVSTVEAGQGDHPWWRAPHRMPTDYDNEFIDPVSGEAASYAEGPIRITPDPTAVAGFH